MPYDPQAATDFLRARATATLPPTEGWPTGAPAAEYLRTPAAMRVGELAAREGLFSFHFERRAHLQLPESWVPEERPELAEPPTWHDGVLEERKYQSFRHDLMIGSFHPLHRAKWTVHELCHGLVGFAWRPGASRLFHATAGRLAELLPVTLWYFLDEAFLRRCADHQGAGALFRELCPACEAAARATPDDDEAPRRIDEARRFLDRELAAIARTRRLGRPVPHRWATLDLCSDGIAYADAHAARLDSDAFLTFAARFLVEGGGWSPTLDDLEARVVQVARALVGEVELTPFAPTSTHGKWRWTLQDVAWRLLLIHAQTEGKAAQGLEDALEHLAAATEATRIAPPEVDADGVDAAGTAALSAVIDRYLALAESFVLPSAEEVFGLGYTPIEGWGTDLAQVSAGVRSAAPLTARALGAAVDAHVLRFVQDDAPRRAPIATRWADQLAAHAPDWVADLARYEAVLRTPPRGDGGATRALGWSGAAGPVRIAPTAALHRFAFDVVGLYAALLDAEDEEVEVDVEGWREPVAVVVLREADGEVGVLVIEAEAADALEQLGDGGTLALDDAEIEELAALEVIAPAAWLEQTSGPV